MGADGEELDDGVGAVDQLMGAGLAAREGDDLALGQFAPAVWGAQRRRPLENDQQLLLGQVEVVRVGGLAGRQLPLGDPEALGFELVSDPGSPSPEAVAIALLVELRIVEVRQVGGCPSG